MYSDASYTVTKYYLNIFPDIFLKVSVKGKTNDEAEQEESYSASPTSTTWLDKKLDAVSFVFLINSTLL